MVTLVDCDYDRLLKQKEIVMRKAVECGIDGMECFPPVHHPETGSQEYLSFAHTHHLIATSGSDYHGTDLHSE